MRRYSDDDAVALHESVVVSLEHLRPWMPWIAHEPLGIGQRRELIGQWGGDWDARRDFTMGIFDGTILVGGTGLHLRGGPGCAEIGYWVRADRAGYGIATRIVVALDGVARRMPGILRVEIRHDEANIPSGRVAEKAGFVMEGTSDRAPQAPGESGRVCVWVSPRG